MARIETEAFEQDLLTFMAARRAAMGDEDSGLGGYYVYRLERGVALTPYERVLFGALRHTPRVFHAGIGIGQLTAALAREGVACVGIEGSAARFEAAVALRDALAPGSRYDLRRIRFPEGIRRDDDPASATLLFTNVANTWTPAQFDLMLTVMAYFERVILDLRLFGEPRETDVERAALSARFEAAGFAVVPLPGTPSDAFYVSLTPGRRPAAPLPEGGVTIPRAKRPRSWKSRIARLWRRIFS